MNKSIDRVLLVVLCLLAGVLFYCISSLIPIVLDDCGYGSSHSLKEIFDYQVHDYLHLNGRVFAHGFGQLFSGILGKGIFDVFTSIVFVALILMIGVCVGYEEDRWFLFSVVLALLWFCYPDQYTTMGMIAGSMNYLWASAVVLLFVLLYKKCQAEPLPKSVFFLLVPFSFLAGAWSEMYAVCLGPALLVDLLMNWRRTDKQAMATFVLFGIGAVFMVFAPGNFVRLNMVTGGERAGLSTYFLNVVCEILKGPLVWIWLAGLVLLFVAKIKGITTIKAFLKENVFWLSAILFSLLFIWISAASWPRTFFAVYTFSFIVVTKLLLLIPLKRWMKMTLVVSVWLFVIVDFINEVKVCSYNKRVLEGVIEEVSNHPEKDCFSFAKMKHSRRAIGNDVLREEKENWRVRSFCNFYNLPHVFSVIPEEVFDTCNMVGRIEAPLSLNDYFVYPVEQRSESIMVVWNEEPAWVMRSKPKRLLAAMGWKRIGKRWYGSQSELLLGKVLLEKFENVSMVFRQPPDADSENFGYYKVNGQLFLFVPAELTKAYEGNASIVQFWD